MLSSINSFVAETNAVAFFATNWICQTVGLLSVYAFHSAVQYTTIEFVIADMSFVSVPIGMILAYLLTSP
jgi:hypothetical protein